MEAIQSKIKPFLECSDLSRATIERSESDGVTISLRAGARDLFLSGKQSDSAELEARLSLWEKTQGGARVVLVAEGTWNLEGHFILRTTIHYNQRIIGSYNLAGIQPDLMALFQALETLYDRVSGAVDEYLMRALGMIA